MVGVSLQTDDPRSPTTGTRDRSTERDTVAGTQSEEDVVGDETLDRSPARISAGIAIGFALLGALTLPSTVLVGIGLLGALLVGAGAVRGTRRTVGHGTLLLLGGVLIGGSQGAPPEPLVLCTLLALLAWDAGRYGITIGEQLGREAETAHIELAHSALNTGIGAAGGGLGYAMYRVITGEQPVAALLLLLFGAVILAVTLR